LKKAQVNRKISWACGLKELILLKYPFFPNQASGSKNSYQNSNVIPHSNGKKILKLG
jgi:hypothetical protein